MNKKTPLIVKILGGEKRQKITIPLLAILIGLIAGGLIIWATGANPFKAYYNILQGCGLAKKPSYGGKKGMITDFMDLLDGTVPMLLASLACAVALKAGLFNIGISGQMMLAGFVATITVGYSTMAAGVAKPLALVIGLAVGALLGAFVGFLKYRFNINEVVSTIMINYTVRYVVTFFINIKYVDPVSRQSQLVSEASRWTLKKVPIGDYKMTIPLGVIVAIAAVIFVYIFMEKTRTGFEIKAVGSSRNGARYQGINVGKNIVLAMTISGGLSGLAGVTYFMGYMGSIQPGVLVSTGFDSIAVCLLGNSNPFGIVFSSLFISGLNMGATYLASASGIVPEISSVIIGVILVFSACAAYIKYLVHKKEQETMAVSGEERV